MLAARCRPETFADRGLTSVKLSYRVSAVDHPFRWQHTQPNERQTWRDVWQASGHGRGVPPYTAVIARGIATASRSTYRPGPASSPPSRTNTAPDSRSSSRQSRPGRSGQPSGIRPWAGWPDRLTTTTCRASSAPDHDHASRLRQLWLSGHPLASFKRHVPARTPWPHSGDQRAVPGAKLGPTAHQGVGPGTPAAGPGVPRTGLHATGSPRAGSQC